MERRNIEERIAIGCMVLSTCLVAAGLVSLLATVIAKGAGALSIDMLIKTPRGGYYAGKEGGILNAIVGSLVLGGGSTALALAVSLPVVFYINLYRRPYSRFAVLMRFFLDVMWGVPSIVYGAFGFTVMAFFGMRASLLAGIVTVALVIIPIMSRSLDESLRMIPFELKEACFSLGFTRLETAVHVIVRQAFPGIVTAVLIAFGRGIGDAASVLFTAGFTDALPTSFLKPVATLPLAIFFQLGTPFREVQARGYASAIVLTAIIVAISVASRLIQRRFSRNIVQ